MKRRPRYAL